jgi:hypothetical protein
MLPPWTTPNGCSGSEVRQNRARGPCCPCAKPDGCRRLPPNWSRRPRSARSRAPWTAAHVARQHRPHRAAADGFRAPQACRPPRRPDQGTAADRRFQTRNVMRIIGFSTLRRWPPPPSPLFRRQLSRPVGPVLARPQIRSTRRTIEAGALVSWRLALITTDLDGLDAAFGSGTSACAAQAGFGDKIDTDG